MTRIFYAVNSMSSDRLRKAGVNCCDPGSDTMTESEWRNAVEPHAMLEFLQSGGKPSDRKLRLFAVACSRRIWSMIDDLGRAAVEAAEEFADGRLSSDEMRAARLACQG